MNETVRSVLLLLCVAAPFCCLAQSDNLLNVNYTDVAIKVATKFEEKCYSNVKTRPAYPVMGPPQGDCGGADCSYPDKLCFWQEEEVKGVKQPVHKCYELSDECKSALSAAGAGSTPAPSDSSTTAATDGDDSTTTAAADGDGSTTVAATDSSTTAPSDGGAAATGGNDWNEFCCFWAGVGECDKNPFFMRTVCQKSCGTVGCTVNKASSCPVTVNTQGCKWTKVGNGGVGVGGGGGGVPTWANADQNPSCSQWAAQGECSKNPVYMLNLCKKSCQGKG